MCTGTATATADGYTAASLVVSFPVDSSSPSTHRIVVSSSADRSGAADLDGRVVSGLSTPSRPRTTAWPVCGSTSTTKIEAARRSGGRRTLPSNLAGGSVTVARPFHTRRLADGSHTVTAVLELSAGGSAVVHATFTVDN